MEITFNRNLIASPSEIKILIEFVDNIEVCTSYGNVEITRGAARSLVNSYNMPFTYIIMKGKIYHTLVLQ